MLGHLRALLLTSLAVVIILTAVVVGIGRALIPYADELTPWLSERLSQRLDQPVHIDRIEAQWPRLTPQLTLHGTSVGPTDAPLLEVDLARLELHLPDLFSAERNPFRLVVLGLDLVLAEDEAGQWGLQLEGGAEMADRSEREGLLAGDLLIRDARLTVRPRRQPEFATRLVEGEIRRRGEQTLVQGLLEPGADTSPGVSFTLLLSHLEGHWIAARAWASGEDLALRDWLDAPWLPADTRVSAEAWLDWSVAGGGRLDLDVGIDDAGLGELSAELALTRSGRTTQLELVSLHASDQPEAPWLRGLAVARSTEAWALAIDQLELGELFEQIAPRLPEDLALRLPQSLSGQIENFQAGWRPGIGLHALEGRLLDLALTWPTGPLDGSGLTLDLGLIGDRVRIEPSGRPRIRWPDLFRDTLALEGIGGKVYLGMDGIELDGLWAENEFLNGWAEGWIYRGPERPFLDLVIHADRVGPFDPRPWLTPRYIPETALTWLDDSLTWVEHAKGIVVLHMRAGKLAREIRPGDFQAEAAFDGVSVDYWPEWPPAEALSGEVEFIGSGLTAELTAGRLGDLPVRAPLVEVADLTEPVMQIEIESVGGDAERIAELMAQMPIPAWETVLAPMRWSGPADVATRLELPFRDMENWQIEGSVALESTRLGFPEWGLLLPVLTGQLAFDRDRIGPGRLELGAGSEDGELTVSATLAEAAGLRIEASVNPADLLQPESPLSELGQRLRGRSQFQLDLQAVQGVVEVTLDSDLSGLRLELPRPLFKDARTRWPLVVQVRLEDGELSGQLGLSDWLNGEWVQAERDWRLSLGLNQQRPELTDQPGLRVRGQLDELALSDWLGLLPGTTTPDGLPLAEVDVAMSLGRLNLFGLDLIDLDLALSREPQAWQIDLSGDSLEGAVTVPMPLDSGRVLVADLRHLYIEPVLAEPDLLDLDIHPLSAQTSTQSPRGLPPLHLLVDDMRWGAMNLGRARLESHPTAEGVEVELIDVSGPDLRLNGRGRWIEREGRIHCEFNGRLTTANLSGLLASAGYELGIEANRAQVDADFRWPGAPVDFSLARLSGALDLQMSDGVIPEARPGAGRLLGLASFSAIPRRLMLDFRDVFGAGLRFDEIQGRFDLAAGFARTDGVVIDSPAARITISGDTDMAARQYDQIILVEPGLGATLPVIGILAGGPVGAAAGLVLRQILERPLRGIAEARYSVTGLWDEPLIELVEARITDEDGEESVLAPPEP